MEEIFTIKNIIIYILLINLFGFLIMWWDKRKAKRGEWRIKESTIFLITALGGGIGTISGMYKFRHKTKKWYFVYGLPFIMILEIGTIIYYIVKYK